jgi:hypothetical protein
MYLENPKYIWKIQNIFRKSKVYLENPKRVLKNSKKILIQKQV